VKFVFKSTLDQRKVRRMALMANGVFAFNI